jgi:hypothetical protein
MPRTTETPNPILDAHTTQAIRMRLQAGEPQTLEALQQIIDAPEVFEFSVVNGILGQYAHHMPPATRR